MRLADILREIAYPVTDLTLLLGIVAFAILSMLAGSAGLLGIWLAVILLPALYRYLLLLLEARANGKPVPVAGIELFNIADGFWTLTPLVLYAIATWGAILLADLSAAAAWAFALLIVIVLPASLAVLAVTHSPFESLNPLAWRRLMRSCGRDYIVAVLGPLSMILLAFLVTSILTWDRLPAVAVYGFACYQLVLSFSLTGAVLHANGVQFQLRIPEPVEADAATVAGLRDKERRDVLTHAYGFVSRGNRAGGLAHIEAAVGNDADPSGAYRWYFDRMLAWESTDAALALAQTWLRRLLAEQREVEALKLMTRCLLENPAFRPLPGDRDAAAETARRFGRDDLLRSLG